MTIYLTQLMAVCFIVGFVLFGVYGALFFCIVQRCSNIPRKESLVGNYVESATMQKNIYLFYDGVCVAKLFIGFVYSSITHSLERTRRVRFFSCIVYILRCSCRMYTIVWSHEDFIHVCLCTNHFLYKALEFQSRGQALFTFCNALNSCLNMQSFVVFSVTILVISRTALYGYCKAIDWKEVWSGAWVGG